MALVPKVLSSNLTALVSTEAESRLCLVLTRCVGFLVHFMLSFEFLSFRAMSGRHLIRATTFPETYPTKLRLSKPLKYVGGYLLPAFSSSGGTT